MLVNVSLRPVKPSGLLARFITGRSMNMAGAECVDKLINTGSPEACGGSTPTVSLAD